VVDVRKQARNEDYTPLRADLAVFRGKVAELWGATDSKE
jgi:hypothetical protein